MEHIKLVGYLRESGFVTIIKEVQYRHGRASGIRVNYKRMAESKSRLDCYKKTKLCIGGWTGYYENGILKSQHGNYSQHK